ncbi:hypothetical protein DENIS_3541 [Desulfonema ishimotonii]|uniref:histidine kinase n=1 Tax=Desulfonema ishimotonii TaxID=45657 RepID=A0A401G015_9BACT|nr:response regulator [Desulfonema ishimotonii]GBC62569.1 hypothetical protein DENIS_3541 [Desulfonema ishimotonii]
MTHHRTQKILMMGDVASLWPGISCDLTDAGHWVVESETGRYGPERIGQEVPDLVLLVLKRSDTDGFAVLDTITRTAPETPVIVISEAGEMAEALRRGAWDCLPRPVTDLTTARRRIGNALRQARLLRENRRYRENFPYEEKEAAYRTGKVRCREIEAMATLANGIAHDFNNLLTMIMGNADLVRRAIPETDPISPNIDNIFTAGYRAKELVMQVLTFCRKNQQKRQPTQLRHVVREVVGQFAPILPDAIEMRHHIPDVPDTVLGDATQLHQVMMNLITNALRAMDNRTGRLDIRMASLELGVDNIYGLPPGPWVCLSVADTGRGISPEILARIFDPYFTTKDKRVGTGLGLSVAQGIVEGHGGVIRARSVPDEGSTFEIFLPRTADDGTGIRPENGLSESAPHSPRILFVDDEKMLAHLGESLLITLGYRVTVETRPEQALRLFSRDPDAFDLVMTDMSMPVMPGHILAEKLLAIRPDIPVILCSGLIDDSTMSVFRRLGVRFFLNKPYKREEFAAAIRQALDPRRRPGTDLTA